MRSPASRPVRRLSLRHVGERVGAGAADEAGDGLSPRQDVVLVLTAENGIAGLPGRRVVAVAAGHRAGAVATTDVVSRGAASGGVGPVDAEDDIGAGPACDHVRTVAADTRCDDDAGA